MEMGTIRTKVSRSHSEIIAFLSLTFCNPNPTYDTDNVILLAQCLANRARLVCRFAIDYLGQDRGQRSWSAKCAEFVIFHAIIVFLHLKKTRNVLILMFFSTYAWTACRLEIGY